MDFVAIGLFKDQEELRVYLEHPDHQQGVRKWKKIANWKVIDIDLSSDTTKFFGLLDALTNINSTSA
ncbi:stress responsive alpha/beta barrel protein [Thiopseudomonas denitrificans]|uniref:Stress responsive alpha/beta barrel protein n=2 Tax=Thiopseudomonas denitrificans TaxID=1501432 RepID=A0A4R6U4N5_9GAMM|nr:stress responsive alpha/beta barrel protein [Thiopseudomonas denitrificans]